MKLESVYLRDDAQEILYSLLKERTPEQSISHKQMPSWEDHVAFIKSEPYQAWYLIEVNDEIVGSIYLSKQREVGLFLFEKFKGQGYGRQALARLKYLHPGRLLANINPKNEASRKFFEREGFKLIQQTYELA